MWDGALTRYRAEMTGRRCIVLGIQYGHESLANRHLAGFSQGYRGNLPEMLKKYHLVKSHCGRRRCANNLPRFA
jgi:hypothetical protein